MDGRRLGLTVNQPIAQPLVVPLRVTVGRVRLDSEPQVPLADLGDTAWCFDATSGVRFG